jgi:hypothetical protein
VITIACVCLKYNLQNVVAAHERTLCVIASLGGGGAIVLGFSGWLGKVWAERLMEKERHEHALGAGKRPRQVREGIGRAQGQVRTDPRRLQNELDKTIYGHQLKTQTEYNALMELWKKVPPLENALQWTRAGKVLGTATPESYLTQLTGLGTIWSL